jgi:hypothetical protein
MDRATPNVGAAEQQESESEAPAAARLSTATARLSAPGSAARAPHINDLPPSVLQRVLLSGSHRQPLRFVATCAAVCSEWWALLGDTAAYGGLIWTRAPAPAVVQKLLRFCQTAAGPTSRALAERVASCCVSPKQLARSHVVLVPTHRGSTVSGSLVSTTVVASTEEEARREFMCLVEEACTGGGASRPDVYFLVRRALGLRAERSSWTVPRLGSTYALPAALRAAMQRGCSSVTPRSLQALAEGLPTATRAFVLAEITAALDGSGGFDRGFDPGMPIGDAGVATLGAAVEALSPESRRTLTHIKLSGSGLSPGAVLSLGLVLVLLGDYSDHRQRNPEPAGSGRQSLGQAASTTHPPHAALPLWSTTAACRCGNRCRCTSGTRPSAPAPAAPLPQHCDCYTKRAVYCSANKQETSLQCAECKSWIHTSCCHPEALQSDGMQYLAFQQNYRFVCRACCGGGAPRESFTHTKCSWLVSIRGAFGSLMHTTGRAAFKAAEVVRHLDLHWDVLCFQRSRGDNRRWRNAIGSNINIYRTRDLNQPRKFYWSLCSHQAAGWMGPNAALLCRGLSSLDLSHNPGLGDDGLVALAECRLPRTLCVIDISNTGCGDRGFMAMVSALPGLPQLQELHCSANPAVGVEAWLALGEVLPQLKALRQIVGVPPEAAAVMELALRSCPDVVVRQYGSISDRF